MNIGQSTEFTFLLETDSQGKARIKNRAEFDEFLRQLPNQKFEVNVRTIKGDIEHRLYAQYFAGVVSPICRAFRIMGEKKTKRQTHEFLKKQNPDMEKEITLPTGAKMFVLKSLSKDCCEQDLYNHIHFCVQYASENLGLDLDI